MWVDKQTASMYNCFTNDEKRAEVICIFTHWLISKQNVHSFKNRNREKSNNTKNESLLQHVQNKLYWHKEIHYFTITLFKGFRMEVMKAREWQRARERRSERERCETNVWLHHQVIECAWKCRFSLGKNNKTINQKFKFFLFCRPEQLHVSLSLPHHLLLLLFLKKSKKMNEEEKKNVIRFFK